MPTISEGVLNYLMAVYFAVFAAAFVFNLLFRRRLRNYHRQAWAQLGNPTLFNNSMQNGLKSTAKTLRGPRRSSAGVLRTLGTHRFHRDHRVSGTVPGPID